VTYIYQVSVSWSPYFIVLASIDRHCASSTSVRLRNLSNIKTARWTIVFVLIFFTLFYINTAILIDLRSTDTFECRIRGDTIYKQVYPVMQIFVIAVTPPGLMVLFGITTICNTKRVNVIPIVVSRHGRTENQLAGMLLIQVGT
jgi:voltage-gated potassium channel Kch